MNPLVIAISMIFFSNALAQSSLPNITWIPSFNYNERLDRHLNKTVAIPTILVLHYTEGSLASTIATFQTNGTVSSHYTVARNGSIYQHVNEKYRAWHAGAGAWRDVDNVNSYSVGIEIENMGYQTLPDQSYCNQTVKGSSFKWCPFDAIDQIESVVLLAIDIVNRYNIEPRNVIAHADLAPTRKEDPGPLFFWSTLANRGIGAWLNEKEKQSTVIKKCDVLCAQKKLRKYGYTMVPLSGKYDHATKDGLVAFQMHFRPTDISGLIDEETISILDSLLIKYANGTA